MPIEPVVRYRGIAPGRIAGLVVLVVFVIALAYLMATRPQGATNSEPIPADVDRLGLIAAPIAPDIVRVSAEEAIASAWEVASNLKDQDPAVNAYLVTATDPNWVEQDGFEDRRIWIVRFSGLDLALPAMPPADGSEAKGLTAHFAYVLIDADSKEAIDYQYWE